MDARDGSGAVDQVEAVRDWLRGHGVDPVGEPADQPATPRGRTSRPDGTTRPSRAGRPAGRGPVPDSAADLEAEAGPAADRGTDPDTDPDTDRDTDRDVDPDADPEDVARRIVLRKLAAQARTRAELGRALSAKAVPEEVAGAVLDRMSEVGLVDDAAFARDWVSSRQQRKHLSRTALRRELQTKGVDREVIDDALAGVGGADEHAAALDLAQRRAVPMAGLAREVAYRRLGGVLARRGFSSSVTARVLAEVLGDWPEE